MADDIFLTQEEQDERAKRWLRENGPAILIGIALGLAGIYGYDEYRIHQIKQAERGAAAFAELVEIDASSDVSDISALADEIKSNYGGTPYAPKAALLKAEQLSATDLDGALAELDWVLSNADERPVWHAANIRKAKILLAKGDPAAALELAQVSDLEGLASHYYEVRADALAAQGQVDAARTAYDDAVAALSPSDSAYARILQLKRSRLASAQAESSTEAQTNN